MEILEDEHRRRTPCQAFDDGGHRFEQPGLERLLVQPCIGADLQAEEAVERVENRVEVVDQVADPVSQLHGDGLLGVDLVDTHCV